MVTISHDPINGYEVEDRNINWDSAENGHVITITYQIITYDIEYSLEVGNPRAIANPSSNNENNVLTYNVEDETINLYEPSRLGYTFNAWYLEEDFNTSISSFVPGSDENSYHKNFTVYVR